MLTEIELTELREIKDKIKDERLASIVKKAIEGWSRDDVVPNSAYYGVSYDGESYTPNGDGCCLLGAASLGKKSLQLSVNTWEWERMKKLFSITEKELDAITMGFDGNEDPESECHPWYAVAWEIGELLGCH